MSQIEPQDHPPVIPAKRKMSAARRQRLLERDDWMCCVKGCPKFYGWPLELDHRLPIELGGTDDDDNLTAICQVHHQQKTRDDIARIAKARRLRAKNADPETRALAKPKGRKMQSRPFQKARK